MGSKPGTTASTRTTTRSSTRTTASTTRADDRAAEQSFAARLGKAVEEQRRHSERRHGRSESAPFATLANPSRVRTREDLVAERVRQALD